MGASEFSPTVWVAYLARFHMAGRPATAWRQKSERAAPITASRRDVDAPSRATAAGRAARPAARWRSG